MKILFIIGALVILAYLVATLIAFKGIPKSIGDTGDKWTDLGHRYLLTIALILSTAFMLPYWLEVSPDQFRFLVFLSSAALFIEGTLRGFREMIPEIILNLILGIWVLLVFSYFIATENWAAVFIGALVTGVTMTIDENRLEDVDFWIGVATFVMTIIGVLLI